MTLPNDDPRKQNVRQDLRLPRGRATFLTRCRVALALVLSALILVCGSMVLLLVAIVTLFQTRRFYTEVIVRGMARMALSLFGVRIIEHYWERFPQRQTVFISNHTSALDMFVIIALGLPNCRYFLSGFLRRFLPLWLIGWLIGIYWTARQTYPERRTRIFQNADRDLKRTGESVFLTPEGQFVGRFNKGAFHLAISLGAPILPIYIQIPNEVDPGPWTNGDGLEIRPGEVHVYYKPLIETTNWTLETLDRHRNEIRDLYAEWKAQTFSSFAKGPQSSDEIEI